ncbi:MAG: class II aldolase/adducin family protein [Acidimicrobiales bacterium]
MSSDSFDRDACDAAKRELAHYCRRFKGDGLSIGTSGNLSVRVGDVVAITPGSHSYDDIQPDDMCVVTLDGSKVEGDGMVSSEWPMHQSIYANTKATAVVHTHSPEVVALSTVFSELPAIHYAIANLGGPVRVVEYRRFGSTQLAEGVLDALSSRTAAILQNHGGVTCGSNLVQAYDRSLLLEWLAGVYRLALQYGDPRILTEGELAEVSAEVKRRRYFGSEPNE